jgi:hypothetical protein
MAKKCYAVYIGRVLGVYDEWLECQAQVYRYPNGSQRGFYSRGEVEDSYWRWTLARERDRNRRLNNYYIIALLLIVIAFLFYIIV